MSPRVCDVQPVSDTIGDFLRSRREQLRPEQVGLPASERRRVPGLRREEVALLAGISSEYYLRLEQGRDLHPSDQVLDALAAALQLDEEAAAYLHRLAHPPRRAGRRRPRQHNPGPALQQMLDLWTSTPAYAQAASGQVVAANRLAVALSPSFEVGSNTLRAAFLDPAMRQLYPEWETVTARAVSALRATVSLDQAEPELLETIGELTIASERFRVLWGRRDVRHKASGPTRMNHPVVGELELHYERMLLPEARLILVVYHADPASPSGERLQLLASL